MQIPKQPRTKPPSAEMPGPDAPQAAQGANTQDATEAVRSAGQMSAEGIQSAYLNAQKEQLAAFLAYLETLQKVLATNPESIFEYLNEASRAQGDALATAEAYRRFIAANADRQIAGQKALIEATTAYSQSVSESYTKLNEQVRQQNQSVAEALKEAVVKMDVRTSDVPTLALLYQGLRTMSAKQAGENPTPA